MTTEVQVITSVVLSDADLIGVVGEVYAALGIAPIPHWDFLWDGESQLWLYRLTAEETGYEEAQLARFAAMLGAPSADYRQIEMGSQGETGYANMALLVQLMNRRWPLVLDDSHDGFYGPGEIAGYFRDRSL